MEKRLVTFGCSNTYGYELEDPDLQAWPVKLGQLLNYKHKTINNGVPGASNKLIWGNALRFDYGKKDVVVCMWSYLSRWTRLRDPKTSLSGVWGNGIACDDSRHSRNVMKSQFGENGWELNRNYFETWEEYDALLELVLYANHMHEFLKVQNIPSYHIWIGGGPSEVTWEKWQNKWIGNLAKTELDDRFKPYFQPDINFMQYDLHHSKRFIDEANDNMHIGPKSHMLVANDIARWISKCG